MADHRFQDDQELQKISFGMMMQPSSSSSSHANSMLKEGGTYDMGELDQILFLYLDGHAQPPVQELKHKFLIQTLNIFPSQPMHVDPSTKGDWSLLPSTSDSSKRSAKQSVELGNPRTDHSPSLSGKGKDIKNTLKKEENKKSAASSSEQEGPKTPDAKTLRRLAQNREAARKSRLRKKAYIHQLESSRIKLIQIEQEIQRTRAQGMFFNGGQQNLSSTVNGLTSDAAVFDMEYGRWKEEHHHLTCELQAAVQEHLPESELWIYVDKCLVHYDEMFQLKNAIIKSDVFHLISGMWISPAERCVMWIGGFRPSLIIKVVLSHIEPLSEQQILGICSLQQSAQETEEALSQGLAALHQSLTDTIISDALSYPSDMPKYMGQMTIAMSKLNNLEGFVRQADNLRQHTLHRFHQFLTTSQAARCFLAVADYFHRLRALSSLWLARPRNVLL